MKKKGFVNITNARNKKGYRSAIQEIIDLGVCPFCPDHFSWHKKPILRKQNNWFITESTWPYENAKTHLLIIGIKHKEQMRELTIKDFQDILDLANWAIETYKIAGGGLTLRFGEIQYTGATVAHIHFHLIVPRIDENGKTKPVWFPIG